MMQKTSFSQRMLAFLLCTVMILSSVSISVSVYAGDSQVDLASVSQAELVADNYTTLSDGEKAILRSGLMAGETLGYPVPQSGDSLISVDAGARKVTASDFVSGGYEWKPVTAVISYSGGNEEIVLEDGVGSFTYEGNMFTVLVNYELNINVDQALQSKLLNGPYYLIKGVKNIDDFDYYYSTFDTVGQNIDGLKKLADGINVSGNKTIKISNEATIAAIYDLYQQSSANGGMIDITAMIEDYELSATKSSYLINYGAEFKAAGVAAHSNFSAIVNDPDIPSLMSSLRASEPATYRKINLAMNAMRSLVSNTAEASADEWGVLIADNNPLKDGFTDEDYIALDALIAEAGDAVYHDDVIKSALLADRTVLSANVNRHDVTVVVNASVIKETAIDSAAATLLEQHSALVRLADGSTPEEVYAAIDESGVEALALSTWEIIDEEHYTRTADVISSALTSDLVYTITYSPKMYTVTYGFETTLPASVPYGYNMKLPEREDTSLVYDYTVNGKAYLQGSVATIKGNTTVNRIEANPWNVQQINKLVAENYSEVLNDVEKEILLSSALKGDTFLLKDPDTVTVSVYTGTRSTKNYLVEAADYASGISGLIWKAVSGKAIVGSDTVTAEFEIENGTAIFESEQFDRVEVEYSLVVSSVVSNDKVLAVLNLPAELAEEAKDQKENLEKLNDLYSKLAQFTRATFNKIKFGVSGSNMSQASKDAVDTVINGCVDSESAELYLYIYLTNYREQGLAYYYQDGNYLRIRNQVQILNDNFSIIYNDPEFLPLLRDIEYEEYYDEIGEIIDKLNSVILTDPNAALNTASPSLTELVAAIELNTNARHFDSVDKVINVKKTVSAAAPQKAIVSVTVEAKNSAGETIKTAFDSSAYSIGEEITAEYAASLDAMLQTLITKAGIDTAHYTTSDTIGLNAGDTLNGNASITITYEPVVYTSDIIDAGVTVESLTFTYDVRTITLPGYAQTGGQYRYTVCGKEIIVGTEAKTVSFTEAQIAGGQYAVITRETVDVNREGTLDLVSDLNKAISSANMVSGNDLIMAFIPMEDTNGNYSLVFRISPKNLSKAKKAIEKMVEAIISSDFTYIKLGDSYLREDSSVSLQAIADVILESGLSLDSLLDLIDKNGDIKEMTLDNVYVIGANADGNISVTGSRIVNDTDVLGGKLIETTLNLSQGRNEPGTSLKLYITLEDFDQSRSSLKNVREMIEKVRAYGNITAHDGIADVEVNLPDRAYQAFLTAMIALDNASLKDLSNFEFTYEIKDLIMSVADFIASDETITTKTIENTAKKADKNIDLSDYTNIFNKARKALKLVLDNISFDNEECFGTIYTSDINVALSEFLDKLEIGDSLRGMIKENDTGIDFGFRFAMNNESAYEALVLDPGASGAAKLVYTRDLESAIANIHDNTVIILLSDINADLNVNKKLFLDLNGNKINGSFSSSKEAYILDSSIETVSGAGITGNVNGNVVITAGTYEKDVSAKIKGGYKMDGNTVVNGYYYVTVEQNEINIHLTPDLDVLEASDADTGKQIAAEIAADLVLNYFMCGSAKISGFSIYDMRIDDVVGLYENVSSKAANDILDCINCSGISAFANDLLSKIFDFSAIGAAVNSGSIAFRYDLEYQPWTFELDHVQNGDYLTANIISDSNNTKTRTLNFYVDQNGELGDTLVGLGNLVSVDARVNLADISYDYNNDDVTVTGSGKADAIVDLTSDPNFAIAVGVVLANGTSDTAKRDALVNGIKKWYDTNYMMSELKDAVENMTTNELLNAFDTDVSFASMVSNLGLGDVVKSEVTALYNKYESAIKSGFAILKKVINIKGSDNTIGSLSNEYGVYTISRDAKTYNKSAKVAKNYGVNATATLESASVTVMLFVEDVPGKFFVGHSLTLEGDIDVNFFMDVTQAGITKEDIMNGTKTLTVSFDCESDADIYSDITGSITINSDNYDTYYDSLKELFKVSFKVAASEMTLPITATATVNGKTFYDTYCVRAYAEIILNDDDYISNYIDNKGQEKYDKLAALVESMLDYGAKAQTVFGINTSEPANAEIDVPTYDVTPAMIEEAISSANMGMVATVLRNIDLSSYGLVYYGTTVVYLSATTLRIYYRVTNMAQYRAALANGVIKAPNENKIDSGYVFYEYLNIPAAELAKFKVLEIAGNICYYSPLNYAKAALSSSAATTAEKELAKAVYRYYMAAKEYFA